MHPSPQPPLSPRNQSPITACANGIRCIWNYLAKEADDPNAERKADALLIAASVLAAMNFQAAISPPGGSYQDTSYINGTRTIQYQAGQSVAAYIDPIKYRHFTIANTFSFTFSMTTMFLFLSGLSLKRRIFSILLTASVFATITATTFSYKLAMEATTPAHDEQAGGYRFVHRLVNAALFTWFAVAGLAIVVFFVTLLKLPVTTVYHRATVKA